MRPWKQKICLIATLQCLSPLRDEVNLHWRFSKSDKCQMKCYSIVLAEHVALVTREITIFPIFMDPWVIKHEVDIAFCEGKHVLSFGICSQSLPHGNYLSFCLLWYHVTLGPPTNPGRNPRPNSAEGGISQNYESAWTRYCVPISFTSEYL